MADKPIIKLRPTQNLYQSLLERKRDGKPYETSFFGGQRSYEEGATPSDLGWEIMAGGNTTDQEKNMLYSYNPNITKEMMFPKKKVEEKKKGEKSDIEYGKYNSKPKTPTTLEKIPGLDKDYSVINTGRKKDWRDAVNTTGASITEGLTNAGANLLKKGKIISDAENAYGTKAKGGMIERPLTRAEILNEQLIRNKIANGSLEPYLTQAKINDLMSQGLVDKAYIQKLLTGGGAGGLFEEGNTPNAGTAIQQDATNAEFEKQMVAKYGADWKAKLNK